jgi:hypothetical protein
MGDETANMSWKERLWILILLLFFGSSNCLYAQDEYPADYFIPPLDGKLLLSGTFGELRSNHFHAGIDMKTGGVEGKPIYAVADGYVSRVKVSTSGYGKAIYVTHPNGYVSVYGHLQRFSDSLETYVQSYQYEKERFVVEMFPGKNELKVKQGEVIAYSGNTGGSTAPHLHFEIREEASQHPINPLLFESISVKDYYRPKIHELVIYPVDAYSMINGSKDTAFFRVGGWGEGHRLNGDPEITLSGKVSFGIRCHDPMNDVANKNGIYTIDFFKDSVYVFGLEMDKISFATTRYLNSLIDYGYYQKQRRRTIRTQIDTNNRLFNYRDVMHNGILEFTDSLSHDMKFVVKDVYGNTSKLVFAVKSVTDTSTKERNSMQETGSWLSYDKQHVIQEEHIRLSFPANAFYRSFYFQFEVSPGDSTMYSKVYSIHNKYTPIHKSYTMVIDPVGIPEEVRDQLYIAVIGNKGSNWYAGSTWKGNKISTTSRSFGDYTLKADSIPPEIDPVNIYDGKNISKQTNLKVKIRDRETGIKRFRGTLNNEWILMEYEPKKSLLEYTFDDRLRGGINKFKVVVEDRLGNETIYEANLDY